MKMKLRAAAVVSASALLLAGCSTGGGGESGGEAGGLVGTGSGDSCAIESPVKVGAALSLTGGAGSYGASQQQGLELALAELNEADGIEYKLSIEDDASEPRQGISVMETFAGDDTSIVLGPTLSNTAVAAMPIANEAGMPVMGISTTAGGITDIGEFVFRDSLTEAQVIPQTIDAVIDEYDLKKVVVMYSNDDAFTESGYEVMAETLEGTDVEVLDTLTFSKADTDFRSLLTAAKDKNPDAIVVSALIEAAIPLVTQARELGIDQPIVGGNGFNNPKLMADAGDAAEGVVVGAAWNSASDNAENQAFLAAYEEKFGAQPDQFAAQAYSALYLIDDAIRSNCSAERADLRDSIAQLTDVATPLGAVSINENRDAEHPAVVQIVKDGKFAVLR
ncbi:ABC transporter substrate-binding protein [Leucobacter aridicollis]|uniref:Branched-chain amino acid transport system substrate-binding protein n=1 Tax=Leucobacter aridicollis TaxID=283878 RepID=A0A852R1L1_9MICO|nr:ABC transporter substrate-binding protein [Leucobacter aridicollis]MBL3681487.1 ABC transporter substrate-binding protein [Leucobacter aridicollis]NYD27481.1 branched-chain amino acid transport system substrate-binding protein [Leucobacter aridicollis]